MIKPYKHNKNDPEPRNTRYVDKWDYKHVRMPCSPKNIKRDGTPRWPIICFELTKLQSLCEIKSVKAKDIQNAIERCTGRDWEIRCLEYLLDHIYSEDDKNHFLFTVLPNIIRLVLNVDNICGQPPPLLKIGSNQTVTMSQLQCASLLSCAFFCLFPRRQEQHGTEYERYQNPNFNTMFFGSRHGPSSTKLEKLRSLLHYFTRITELMPVGVLSFSRYCLPENGIPDWNKSKNTMCKLHLTKNKSIEDMHGFIQVDFANEYIGGGVMDNGCVQEEIRFIIYPEMLISLLLCEVMADRECISFIGCERFSSYKGYSTTYEWNGTYNDTTSRDNWGRRLCHVVAIDAIRFSDPREQWKEKWCRRELLKAYAGFRVSDMEKHILNGNIVGIATGNWGCGAFRGDKQLKALIQLMAASQAERPLIYCTRSDSNFLNKFGLLYDCLTRNNVEVNDLFKYLIEYSNGVRDKDLFDHILLKVPVIQ
ncbi:unnamed protein product [Didymodactylos carnosus]|uniref:poly(ADP-ribose) glycohydrolase n=1 Tax=Didymodactylos carnosus TaxID=1234261 RepID=A0A814G354_9BILA|nr:unnamed protein product [Didymodactylos carnosus]CAF0988463.1 unnamed protein product [Didymodactylos carnosus]CAF3744073.1 unnamed protein product [Didymodactylos carnosus]CAF3760618.1 unnamed protein product [Didymodactylos carnosus]